MKKLPIFCADLVLIVLFVFFLTGCSTQTPSAATLQSPTVTGTSTPHTAPALTIAPSATSTQLPPTEKPVELCSPITSWTLEELQKNISNPYHPPPFGSDDPHQAIDLTIYDSTRTLSLEGEPIHAVLTGTVAGVVLNRFPYGNAVLIETPLESLPPDWVSSLQVTEILPTPEVSSSLSCPPDSESASENVRPGSIYLLYAHMKSPPALSIGDMVTCDQEIGSVGGTGNALNPHLHLEVRVGPEGARFNSMAHYDVSATPEEMANYCDWRISGRFYRIDPMRLLIHLP